MKLKCSFHNNFKDSSEKKKLRENIIQNQRKEIEESGYIIDEKKWIIKKIDKVKEEKKLKKGRERNRIYSVLKRAQVRTKMWAKGFNVDFPINKKYGKIKDTIIELKVEAELQKRGINYQKQVRLCKGAVVDFYLPEYKMVIECDGDYWHNRIGCKEKDEQRDKILTLNGFDVHHFWEHEINKSVKKCINRINLEKSPCA